MNLYLRSKFKQQEGCDERPAEEGLVKREDSPWASVSSQITREYVEGACKKASRVKATRMDKERRLRFLNGY